MAKAMFVNTYAENYGRVVLKSRNSFQSPVAEEKEPVSSRRKSSKGSNRRRGSVDPKLSSHKADRKLSTVPFKRKSVAFTGTDEPLLFDAQPPTMEETKRLPTSRRHSTTNFNSKQMYQPQVLRPMHGSEKAAPKRLSLEGTQGFTLLRRRERKSEERALNQLSTE